MKLTLANFKPSMTSVSLQEAQHRGMQELLKTQQESEKAFRDNVFSATEKLDAENSSLIEKCKTQDDILRLQQQQFDECSATIDQAKKVCPQTRAGGVSGGRGFCD